MSSGKYIEVKGLGTILQLLPGPITAGLVGGKLESEASRGSTDYADLGEGPGPTTNTKPLSTYPGRQLIAPGIKYSKSMVAIFWGCNFLRKSDYS